MLVIPGNHDIDSKSAARFSGDGYDLVESIDAAGFLEIYNSFGYNMALNRDKNSLSYTYDLSPNYRLLMVDVNTEKSPGILTDETFEWIIEQLEEAKSSDKKSDSCQSSKYTCTQQHLYRWVCNGRIREVMFSL